MYYKIAVKTIIKTDPFSIDENLDGCQLSFSSQNKIYPTQTSAEQSDFAEACWLFFAYYGNEFYEKNDHVLNPRFFPLFNNF